MAHITSPLATGIVPSTTDGSELAEFLDQFLAAQASMHSHTSRPTYLAAGSFWVYENDSSGYRRLYYYDGSANIPVLEINLDTGVARFIGVQTSINFIGNGYFDFWPAGTSFNIASTDPDAVELAAGWWGNPPENDTDTFSRISIAGEYEQYYPYVYGLRWAQGASGEGSFFHRIYNVGAIPSGPSALRVISRRNGTGEDVTVTITRNYGTGSGDSPSIIHTEAFTPYDSGSAFGTVDIPFDMPIITLGSDWGPDNYIEIEFSIDTSSIVTIDFASVQLVSGDANLVEPRRRTPGEDVVFTLPAASCYVPSGVIMLIATAATVPDGWTAAGPASPPSGYKYITKD